MKSKAKAKAKSAPKRKALAAARKATPAPRSRSGKSDAIAQPAGLEIPRNVENATPSVDGGPVNLTNLNKIYFPELGLTKRDLLQYYLDVSPWLLPHLQNRAMVMKRYPNGINGEFFFMKRAPSPRPD